MNLDPLARAVAVSVAALAPVLAGAALQATPYGARSNVSIDYATPGRAAPHAPVLRHRAVTGDYSATVPSGSAASDFGSSSLAVDLRIPALQSAYREPVLGTVGGLPASTATTRWWDTFTVTGGSGAGSMHLDLRYSASFAGDGSLTYVLSQPTATGSDERLRIEGGSRGAGRPADVSVSAPVSNAIVGVDIPFQYGQPFQLVSSLGGSQVDTCCTQAFENMSVDFVSLGLAPGSQLSVASGVRSTT